MATTLDLILICLQAAGKVLLIAVVGAVVARYGLLSKSTLKGLNQLVLYIFTPCLLFTKVGDAVDATRFLGWWPLAVTSVGYMLAGLLLGYIVSMLLHLVPEQRRLVMATMAFKNTTSLPISLVESLCLSAPELIADADDTPEKAAARGVAYVLFYTALASMLRWTVCYPLMAPTAAELREQEQRKQSRQHQGPEPAQDVYGAGKQQATRLSSQQFDQPAVIEMQEYSPYGSSGPDSNAATPEARISLDDPVTNWKSTSPQPVLGNAPAVDELEAKETNDPDADDEDLLGFSDGPPTLSARFKFWSRRTLAVITRTWRHFSQTRTGKVVVKILDAFNPPLVAALLALFVGLISPLKGIFFGADAPLRLSLTAALSSLGNCAVPSILLALGAQLSEGPKRGSSTDKTDAHLGVASYIAIIVVNQFLFPLVGLAWTLCLALSGGLIRFDPVLQFVLLVQACSPAAINLLTLASMHEHNERVAANILFYSYLIAVVSMTACCLFFLEIIERIPAWLS